MTMFKHKGNVYQTVEAGPWLGFEPVEAPEVANPCFRWQWDAMPLSLVRQITSFFEWSLGATGGETVVHLFYNEAEGLWKAVVFPQRGYTGMSVSLIAEHPGRARVMEELGPGYEPAGTWHHHAQAPAFQSGTDKRDEEETWGLHVTVGNIGSGEYSLDARCSFKKQFTPAVLSDWVEVPPTGFSMPDGLADAWLRHLICQPAPEAPFPDWWKDNVFKAEPVQKVHWGPYHEKAYDENVWGDSKDIPAAKTHRKSIFWLGDDLEEVCRLHGLEPGDLADLIEREYQPDELLVDLAVVMAEHHVKTEDVVQELRAQHREKLKVD